MAMTLGNQSLDFGCRGGTTLPSFTVGARLPWQPGSVGSLMGSLMGSLRGPAPGCDMSIRSERPFRDLSPRGPPFRSHQTHHQGVSRDWASWRSGVITKSARESDKVSGRRLLFESTGFSNSAPPSPRTIRKSCTSTSAIRASRAEKEAAEVEVEMGMEM
jgi:hypothetical protein